MDQDLLDQLVAWRRALHRMPEPSGAEECTARFVVEILARHGIAFETGIGGHGIIATLERGTGGRTVGLRADMDALPIVEANDTAYVSQNPGFMHACGHDGHTVALLGSILTLNDDPRWDGTIHFLFQPAEENGAGAKAMIADGLFGRFPMERIFAFHNWPGLEAGTVAVHDGPVMAAGGGWTMTLRGLAGHAATPHKTRDPIVAAGHLIVALQSIVSRSIDPSAAAVLSIGTIQGGTASNQIPAEVRLTGTLRTYDPAVRQTIIAAMERIGNGIAASFDMAIDIDIRSTGRAVDNTPAEVDLAVAAAHAAGLPVRRDLPPSGAGDDFSFLVAERPGAYVWIGNGGTGAEDGLHNDRYDFNDAVLPAAVQWMSSVARLALAR